jgi:hypothetical protein
MRFEVHTHASASAGTAVSRRQHLPASAVKVGMQLVRNGLTCSGTHAGPHLQPCQNDLVHIWQLSEPLPNAFNCIVARLLQSNLTNHTVSRIADLSRLVSSSSALLSTCCIRDSIMYTPLHPVTSASCHLSYSLPLTAHAELGLVHHQGALWQHILQLLDCVAKRLRILLCDRARASAQNSSCIENAPIDPLKDCSCSMGCSRTCDEDGDAQRLCPARLHAPPHDLCTQRVQHKAPSMVPCSRNTAKLAK